MNESAKKLGSLKHGILHFAGRVSIRAAGSGVKYLVKVNHNVSKGNELWVALDRYEEPSWPDFLIPVDIIAAADLEEPELLATAGGVAELLLTRSVAITWGDDAGTFRFVLYVALDDVGVNHVALESVRPDWLRKTPPYAQDFEIMELQVIEEVSND